MTLNPHHDMDTTEEQFDIDSQQERLRRPFRSPLGLLWPRRPISLGSRPEPVYFDVDDDDEPIDTGFNPDFNLDFNERHILRVS